MKLRDLRRALGLGTALREYAAMPEDGDFTFHYSNEGYCNGGFHHSVSRWVHGHFVALRVAGRNLVRYLRHHAPESLGRLRYVKIDTEGFDRTVARTLRDLLRSSRPYVKAVPDELA